MMTKFSRRPFELFRDERILSRLFVACLILATGCATRSDSLSADQLDNSDSVQDSSYVDVNGLHGTPPSTSGYSGWAFAGSDCLEDGFMDSPVDSPRDIGEDSSQFFEPWSLVVLPDTQNYSHGCPEMLLQQTRWIVDNAAALNVRFVVQVGDLTNSSSITEWQAVAQAFKTLYDAEIPFAVVPGNHDFYKNTVSRASLLSEYIPPEMYSNSEKVGFFEEGVTNNSWHLISSGPHQFLVLALEFGPRDEVVDWARRIISEQPGAMTILVTHAYLYNDDTRFDWAKKGASQKSSPHSYAAADLPGGVNDGQELWEDLIYENADARLVLSGHTLGDGIGHAADVGLHGNTVHQLLANYQAGTTPGFPYGGGGNLRVIEFFSPKSALVETFSTYYQLLLDDSQNDFFIRFNHPVDEEYPTASGE